jgi:hypothetical protein
MFRHLSLCSAAALAAALAMPASAEALTMKECSAKYQAAKEAGTLKGMKWNDFRKAECSDDDASEADAAAAEQAAEKTGPKPSASPTAATEKTAAPKTTVSGKVAFPSDVSPKYASETPGKARMHTCLDQYRANKEKGVEQPNWIAKGGGYYSQCNAKLKQGA